MKKKLLSAINLILCALVLCSCGKKAAYETTGSAAAQTASASISIAEGEELFCLAETEEEAEQIAEQYGISLVSFSNGVATFHSDGDLSAIIDNGKENGWPLLEINYINSTN